MRVFFIPCESFSVSVFLFSRVSTMAEPSMADLSLDDAKEDLVVQVDTAEGEGINNIFPFVWWKIPY